MLCRVLTGVAGNLAELGLKLRSLAFRGDALGDKSANIFELGTDQCLLLLGGRELRRECASLSLELLDLFLLRGEIALIDVAALFEDVLLVGRSPTAPSRLVTGSKFVGKYDCCRFALLGAKAREAREQPDRAAFIAAKSERARVLSS